MAYSAMNISAMTGRRRKLQAFAACGGAATMPVFSRSSSFLCAHSAMSAVGVTRMLCAARMDASPVPGRGGVAKVVDPIPKTRTKQEILLADFICNGPVFITADLPVDEDGIPYDFDEWVRLGALLEDALGAQASNVRVYHYYLPVYFWILRELERHRASFDGEARPLIVGFSCPQGGGKTTMTTFIEKMLEANGRVAAIASLDDFYVSYKEQVAIAQKYPGNRFMQYRGMPGTHDMNLMFETLDSIRAFCEAGDCSMDFVSVPRYDKTAYGGRGDRAPKDKWKTIRGTVDVVLLEGWCMGFEHLPPSEVQEPDLHVVNESLRDFEQLYDRLDGMLVIEIADMDWVYGWRLEAERATIAAGKPGLTDDQVKDFVSRFMPAYKHYSPGLYCRKSQLVTGHELHIKIDQKRRPIHSHT